MTSTVARPIRPAAAMRPAEAAQLMLTGAVYRIPVPQATSIDAPAVAEAFRDPFFSGAAELLDTAPTIDIDRVVGTAIAETVRTSNANLGAALRSAGRATATLRLFVPIHFPTPGATWETFSAISRPAALCPGCEAALAPPLAEERVPSAFRAFKELGEWLEASDEQIAEAIGIGRTTVYAWRREGREPRRGTARRIYEYHSVLGSIRRHLGGAGLVGWLHEGEPRREDLLLAGRLEAIEADVDAVLFRGPGRPDLGWKGEDTGPLVAEAGETPLRPSGRRARRVPLN